MYMKLIDTHAHLEQIDNLEQVLQDAKSAGVEAIIAVGVDGPSNKRIIELTKVDQPVKIFPALGIHPGEIKTERVEETIKFIEQNLNNLIAIGEIGLDFWYKQAKKPDKKQQQIDVFKRQLAIAKKNNLPVSIHSRGAWADCVAFCHELEIEKAVFHWYSGPIDILRLILDRGYFVSFTPALEYSKQHREAAEYAPLDRLMIETDSPVRFTAGSIKENSQPKDVFRSLKYLAKIKSVAEEELAKKTFENSAQFFNLSL